MVGGWLPVVTHWSLYRLHGFFMMKGAYMVLEIIKAILDLASKALAFMGLYKIVWDLYLKGPLKEANMILRKKYSVSL